MEGKLVLLCVSGSIAAYKAAELARQLNRAGASVRVAMTRAATEFVGPLTFQAITGAPVHVNVFESADGPVDRYSPAGSSEGPGTIQHIDMSKTPDLILVAPATADLIGRVAAGLGDDVVTTSILAADAPVVFAPAMNQRMWANTIVRGNVERLRAAGYHIIGPATGSLACGETGSGRMSEPDDIVAALSDVLGDHGPAADLSGTRVLVTLGRTEEDIDPVRYISNRSSGKMGIAIAKAAVRAGADVRVVAGVTSVPVPDGFSAVRTRTAAEMKDAVHDHFPDCDVLVMAAAVADYRAATEKPHKMESGEKRPSLDLAPTDDILLSLKPLRKHQIMVGFALETRAEERRAREKLKRKGLDLIVANNPLKAGAGFGTDTNLVSFIRPTGSPRNLSVMAKDEIARLLMEEIARIRTTSKPRRPAQATGKGAERPRAADKPPADPAPRSRPRSGRGRSRSTSRKSATTTAKKS